MNVADVTTLSSIYQPEMKIVAFKDEMLEVRGAEKLFSTYIASLRNRGHSVKVCTRSMSEYWEKGLGAAECVGTPRKLLRFINDSDADIVWLTHFKSVWILPFINKPAVFHFLEPPRSFHEPWIWEQASFWRKILIWGQGHIDRYIVKHYLKHAIAISAFSAETFYLAYGRFANWVYPGVDTEEFYKAEGLWDRRNYVLLVGGGNAIKQVELAIAACAVIPKEARPTLAIVSKKRADMQELADNLEVTIEWNEMVDTEKLRTLYQRAICTLCTSVAEPFGLTAIESIACGTPVVAVDEGGFRETVKECVGIRVPRHPLPFAQAIAHFIEHPKRVELNEKFKVENCVDEFEDHLNQIVRSVKKG